MESAFEDLLDPSVLLEDGAPIDLGGVGGEHYLHGLGDEGSVQLVSGGGVGGYELGEDARRGIAAVFVERAELALRSFLREVELEATASLVGFGGVRHSEELGECPRDDSQFVRGEFGHKVYHGGQSPFALVRCSVAADGAALLGHFAHLLHLLQHAFAVVKGDGISQKCSHGSHVGSQHLIIVHVLLAEVGAIDGIVRVECGGGEETRFLEAVIFALSDKGRGRWAARREG